MTVQHPENIRSMLADFVTGQIDAGSAEGKLIFLSATDTIVSVLRFSKPAFAPAISGRAVANSITSDPSSIGGTIAKAKICDSNDNAVIFCSVTGPGGNGDIIASYLVVAPGQEMRTEQLTYEISTWDEFTTSVHGSGYVQ